MDAREQRAILIAAMFQIDRKGGNWLVPSQTTPGRRYQVTLIGAGSCTCPDHVDSGYCCKHIRAVKIVLKREIGTDSMIATMQTKDIIFEEKKKIPRDYAAFNEAQAVEKRRIQELLHDLCECIVEPERTKRGRKPHTIKDSIFSMTLKVYGTKASRTTSCDLLDAHERGYLSAPIPGMKVCVFFENPVFTPILTRLILSSALPLRAIEKTFAVDSSGFPNTKSENWFDYQKGVSRRRTIWTKAHVACGTKTNIVTAIRILDKDAADSPQFDALVRKVAEQFGALGEVYADKAYLIAANVDLVFSLGGTPYIHPKENTTGGVGGKFAKMYHLFLSQPDEFLKHYHQRSNVETAFSMVKRKFGEYVRSKCETAMVNEVLCKFLCHNLCVVNQEEQELGIKPSFNAAPLIKPKAHFEAEEPTLHFSI